MPAATRCRRQIGTRRKLLYESTARARPCGLLRDLEIIDTLKVLFTEPIHHTNVSLHEKLSWKRASTTKRRLEASGKLGSEEETLPEPGRATNGAYLARGVWQ
ncbi:hypothetical protein Aduo_008280 [Ancylostoma duodenale]